MVSTVLIVKDDPDTVDVVRLYLRRDGYKVLTTTDGKEGLRLARESHPDLVVLDLMLTGMNGLEICSALRQEGSDVPIIMLTARVGEADRLNRLDLGADDYMTKPFSARELAARVRAVLRRTARERLEMRPAELVYEDIRIDMRNRVAYVRGKEVHLTPIECRILVLLIRNSGRTFTREQIIDRVFGYDFDGFERTVDTHMFNLRGKIEADPSKPQYIRTVYRVGYRFGDA
jgi:two-component system alkaline phosphatase synthesis response regulator PhoP